MLTADGEATFFRRLKSRDVGFLPDHTTEWFFREMLDETGRNITEDALALMVTESGGWPHVMQLVGYNTMEGAGDASSDACFRFPDNGCGASAVATRLAAPQALEL